MIGAVGRPREWGFAIAVWMLAMQAGAQEGALQGGWVMDVRGAWMGLAPTDAAQAAIAGFDRSVDDPSMRCVAPALLEIIEQDHQILILYESFNVIRRIHLTGDVAPERLPASPVGYSVGAWHGDELVVETTRLTPHLLNDDGFPFSGGSGSRVVERYRPSGDRLEVEFTVEDPVYLQQPATRTLTFDRVPDLVLLHFSCDPLDATGWRLPATGDSLRDLLQWLDLRPPIPERR
ncbi:MAG TPA: hypothetical protein VLD39_13760 [Gammaproteobacteria bacterium]|nr:hypothetical protein [Gammaproteobacteria bacterium]